MTIKGELVIGLVRWCLSQLVVQLNEFREESRGIDGASFPVNKNALLFTMDMSLASSHLLGLRLYEEQASGEVELHSNERAVVGMAAHFTLPEAVAQLVDDTLEGLPVDDDKVINLLTSLGMQEVIPHLKIQAAH